MSSVLLAGLTDQETAALEVLIGMHWRDWKTVSLARSVSLSVPRQNSVARASDICVVDLFGLGMRRFKAENAPVLMDFLGGRSAILLVWGDGGGWLEQKLRLEPGQKIEWIKVPYDSMTVIAAIERVVPQTRGGKAAAGAASRTPSAPVSAAAAGEEGEVPNDGDVLPALRAAFPQLDRIPVVRLLARLLQPVGTQVVSVRGEPTLIADAQQSQLATSLPLAPLLKLLLTPEMMANVRVVTQPDVRFEDAVRRHFGRDAANAQTPLDVLAWELGASALRDVPMDRRADLSLRLLRMPDFTLLGSGDGMDVQLAAICARAPQSVSALARIFPRREDEVHRFAILSILAGLAEITQAPPVQQRAPEPQKVAPKGFFKSLLAKLF